MKMVTERKQSTVASEKKAAAITAKADDMIVQKFSLIKEDDISEIVKPLSDLVVALDREARSLVVTSMNKTEASNLGARISKAKKVVNEKRIEIKAPYLEACKAIDNGFMPIVKALDSDADCVGDKLAVVLKRERLEAQEEAQRMAEAARKQAAEEARKEGLSKAKAAKVGDEVATVVYANISQGSVTGMATAAGSSKLKAKKDFELVDISKVPANFLTVDREKVMAAINSGVEAIPGLRIVETETIQFRTR